MLKMKWLEKKRESMKKEFVYSAWLSP